MKAHEKTNKLLVFAPTGLKGIWELIQSIHDPRVVIEILNILTEIHPFKLYVVVEIFRQKYIMCKPK